MHSNYLFFYCSSISTCVLTLLDNHPSLVELDQCDAEAIVNALKLLLAKMKLNIQNLLAIGTANASVMVGVNNGVYAKLKVKLPHLILTKCLCHSLQLAVSQASRETLPKELEFLIAETNRSFSH